mgnify:CR=1 FL=1
MKTKLKELRARFNLTQDDLANKVRVRRETILFIEKGKYNVKLMLRIDSSHLYLLSIFLFKYVKRGKISTFFNYLVFIFIH